MDLHYNLTRDTAKATNLEFDTVDRIRRSLFEYVAKSMEEGELQAVRLPYFGLFFCKPIRVQRLIEKGTLPSEMAEFIPALKNKE